MGQQLEVREVKLEANDLVKVLLYILLEFYNNLIIALESWVEVDLNIEFVRAKFLHEELKKKDVEGWSERRFALVAHTFKAMFNNLICSKLKVATKRDKKKDLCNYCKKPSHWAWDWKKKVLDLKKLAHTQEEIDNVLK